MKAIKNWFRSSCDLLVGFVSKTQAKHNNNHIRVYQDEMKKLLAAKSLFQTCKYLGERITFLLYYYFVKRDNEVIHTEPYYFITQNFLWHI